MPDNYARERLLDPVQVHVARKVTSPSVLDMLRAIPPGDFFSVKQVAKRRGSTEATLRTIISNCNSTAPSNERYYKLGLRFEVKRGANDVLRTA